MSRVFILGAGFSRQAGMPLTTDLTSLILDRPVLRDWEEMQAWVVDLKQRLALMEGKGAADFELNVEQLFDIAPFDAELWRMNQQPVRVSRGAGRTPWKKAEKIERFLDLMVRELPRVISEEQQRADPAPIHRFTHFLSDTDTIITFNYDTLVERALSQQHKGWNHGFDAEGKGGTTVLKMHGSIDWVVLGRRTEREAEGFVKIYSKEVIDCIPPAEEQDLKELWRAKDLQSDKPAIDLDKGSLRDPDPRPGVGGLGRYKPLHALPGSAKTWHSAFQALREATGIYVIGFSMSPYDTMTRFHFSHVMHARQKAPLKIVVVDPKPRRLARIFRRILGHPPVLVPKAAEEVDWQQTIG